ncbi:prefoldin subunit 5 [Coprinopsis cinerea okayama7|uniref:Prefoldin subunit 5 n=1 Tax=Coprinopsis cinerea (strain Okayama-7 / 130 / ATCC MYA-4618 / FGSC 9003) TaxID=240176 RepID=A8P240_COPC7|nr:prefoldin subunit 5 [Coprinopsis cinerea okayama7\|eukprot:XP_001838238.1 prefoldin subunit 5 [Coprinopsis cinerea okayama7\
MSAAQQSQGQQVINIADLDIAQLGEIKKQLEEELNHLTSSFAKLKQAQGKFKACVQNVKDVKPDNADKTILVPLTNSLYVPGKLTDTKYVIVDVGTGYYVKKTREQAQKYYEAKIDYLQTNLVKLEDTINRKRENMSMVVNVIQQKVAAAASSAGPAGQKKS